ncbi:MAG TPA: hypothetical protein DDW17_05205 [Deltaproteobacteria bacterium]|nr:hypothetical protein [Deltaproteobacteria bacterium]
MTIEELAELLLAYLYDKTEAEVHSYFFFPLADFMGLAKIDDGEEVLKAAHLLEAKGFILLSQDYLGQVNAMINPDGYSFVEAGGKTGIIGKYRENPDFYMSARGEIGETFMAASSIPVADLTLKSQPRPVTDTSTRANIKQYILQIIDTILNDTTIDDDMREDLLRDAESLYMQLNKHVRNRVVIDALIIELSSIPSIVPIVTSLSSFL